MSNKPVGGRGVKAPYKTVVVRVPEPLTVAFNVIIEQYRDAAMNAATCSPEALTEFNEKYTFITHNRNTAIGFAKKLLTHKKSAKYSLEKLLQLLFNDNSIKL